MPLLVCGLTPIDFSEESVSSEPGAIRIKGFTATRAIRRHRKKQPENMNIDRGNFTRGGRFRTAVGPEVKFITVIGYAGLLGTGGNP